MPQRRHLWRGIHDAEWVKGGVRVEEKLDKAPGELRLTLDVFNAAVGHKFPTYITPKVFVRAALLDGGGKKLAESQQEAVIGWDARFEGGEWVEYFDTRIPPGEKFRHTFRWTALSEAAQVRVWIEVHPDHFYHVHFYPAYLQRSDLSPQGRKLIQKALEESGRTPYTLFEKLIALQ